jgi:collagen type I/II/III/V/XI/XXIV/XXVII alpha
MTTLGSSEVQTEALAPLSPGAPDELEDYVWDELPGRPVRKRMGPFTIGMIVLLLMVGSFFGGVRLEKSKVKGSAGSGGGAPALAALVARAAAARGGAATGTGATGTGATGATATGATGAGASGAGGASSLFGGGAGGARSGITGTITLIDGSNVYITETTGTIVKVATNPGTTFSITSTGTVANLHPGDEVRATGPTGADGTVTGVTITDLGAGPQEGAAAGGGPGFTSLNSTSGTSTSGTGTAAGGAAAGGAAAGGAAGGGGAAKGG